MQPIRALPLVCLIQIMDTNFIAFFTVNECFIDVLLSFDLFYFIKKFNKKIKKYKGAIQKDVMMGPIYLSKLVETGI